MISFKYAFLENFLHTCFLCLFLLIVNSHAQENMGEKPQDGRQLIPHCTT